MTSNIPHIDNGLPIDWTPQLIALDIDDTLTVHLGDMKPRVIEAIAGVREKGIDVVLATGRSFDTTTPVAKDAGLDGYVVCSNGAILGDVAKDKIEVGFFYQGYSITAVIGKGHPVSLFGQQDFQ